MVGKWVLELQRTFQDVGWGEDEALRAPGRGGKAKPAQPDRGKNVGRSPLGKFWPELAVLGGLVLASVLR